MGVFERTLSGVPGQGPEPGWGARRVLMVVFGIGIFVSAVLWVFFQAKTRTVGQILFAVSFAGELFAVFWGGGRRGGNRGSPKVIQKYGLR